MAFTRASSAMTGAFSVREADAISLPPEYLLRDPVNRGTRSVRRTPDGADLQGFKPQSLRSQRGPQGVRGGLETGADLGQFAGREVDALLLRIGALAHGGELICHVPDRLGQLGKLAGDKRRVLPLRHLARRILAGRTNPTARATND